MERFADLHLHTVFSDGTLTPQELMQEVKKENIYAVSICDHDAVDGIEPAVKESGQLAIEVIPGIELSAEYEAIEVHILGYFIDSGNDELRQRLVFLKHNRRLRVQRIVEKLRAAGMDINSDSVFALANEAPAGRVHIARVMLKQGIVASIPEAFYRYIGDNCPAYVAGFKFSPVEAIELVKRCGGIPVLAHPYILKRDNLIPELADRGLMGLEVYYPEYSQSVINFYLQLAAKLGLLVTGGSDFHGEARASVKIGSVKIPYALVERLKAALAPR